MGGYKLPCSPSDPPAIHREIVGPEPGPAPSQLPLLAGHLWASLLFRKPREVASRVWKSSGALCPKGVMASVRLCLSLHCRAGVPRLERQKVAPCPSHVFQFISVGRVSAHYPCLLPRAQAHLPRSEDPEFFGFFLSAGVGPGGEGMPDLMVTRLMFDVCVPEGAGWSSLLTPSFCQLIACHHHPP